jgi:hypothetical protein
LSTRTPFIVGPALHWFTDSPDAGDPACRCSRCGQIIEEDDGPVVRLFKETRELRFHPRCFEEALETGDVRMA